MGRISHRFLPVGSVPSPVAAHLGANTRTAVISPDTYGKQVRHHPEMTAFQNAILPSLLLAAEVYVQSNGKVQLNWTAGVFGFEATVKTTCLGELFLVSFFRASRPRIEQTRLRNRRIC